MKEQRRRTERVVPQIHYLFPDICCRNSPSDCPLFSLCSLSFLPLCVCVCSILMKLLHCFTPFSSLRLGKRAAVVTKRVQSSMKNRMGSSCSGADWLRMAEADRYRKRAKRKFGQITPAPAQLLVMGGVHMCTLQCADVSWKSWEMRVRPSVRPSVRSVPCTVAALSLHSLQLSATATTFGLPRVACLSGPKEQTSPCSTTVAVTRPAPESVRPLKGLPYFTSSSMAFFIVTLKGAKASCTCLLKMLFSR